MIDSNSTLHTDDSELATLREQYRALQSRIDAQRIVTDSMIRDIVRTKVGDVHKTIRNMALLGIVGIVLWAIIALAFNLSLLFASFTIILMIGDMIMDQWAIRPLDFDSVQTVNLVDMAKNAQESRRRLRLDVAIGVSIVIPWAFWAFWEMTSAANFHDVINPLIWGAIVVFGAIIGIIIAVFIVKNLNSKLGQLESQIEEYRKLQ